MKKLLAVLCFLPLVLLAQQDSILSGAYDWKQPGSKKNGINAMVLAEGKVHDFEWMQLTANTLEHSGKNVKLDVPKNQEQVILVKNGKLQLCLGDSTHLLEAGTVAVLMPGEVFSINTKEPCSFYMIKYRSRPAKLPGNPQKKFSSFVQHWDSIPFKPNNNGGGRRDFFEQGTALQKRFEMHVTTLKEGLRSHDPHKHRAEEIVLLVEGETGMQIGEKFYTIKQGGFYYLGSNVLHAIKTIGPKPSTYFAIQFE